VLCDRPRWSAYERAGQILFQAPAMIFTSVPRKLMPRILGGCLLGLVMNSSRTRGYPPRGTIAPGTMILTRIAWTMLDTRSFRLQRKDDRRGSPSAGRRGKKRHRSDDRRDCHGDTRHEDS
jgi:hypothetical protein